MATEQDAMEKPPGILQRTHTMLHEFERHAGPQCRKIIKELQWVMSPDILYEWQKEMFEAQHHRQGEIHGVPVTLTEGLPMENTGVLLLRMRRKDMACEQCGFTTTWPVTVMIHECPYCKGALR